MLTIIKRLRERMIGPIVTRIGELEANHTAYLSSHLDGIEAKLLGRLADSEQATHTLIERTRQEMRDRSTLQLRSFIFEGTCVKDLRAETSEGSFFFDVKDDIVGWSLAQETWEPAETDWIKSNLRPGDFAIDVGANLGWYTVIMARLVGNKGLVAAFEPEPRNFELLTRNVEENNLSGSCRLFQTALFNKAGTFTLEKSPNNLGDHRIRIAPPSKFSDNYFGEAEREEISVPAESLDDMLSKMDLNEKTVRLLKLDTQGSEVLIMRGAEQTLARTEFLISEYWPYGMKRLGVTADDFYACVKDKFSEFSRCKSGEWQFKPIFQLSEDLAHSCDADWNGATYVFRKQESR